MIELVTLFPSMRYSFHRQGMTPLRRIRLGLYPTQLLQAGTDFFTLKLHQAGTISSYIWDHVHLDIRTSDFVLLVNPSIATQHRWTPGLLKLNYTLTWYEVLHQMDLPLNTPTIMLETCTKFLRQGRKPFRRIRLGRYSIQFLQAGQELVCTASNQTRTFDTFFTGRA